MAEKTPTDVRRSPGTTDPKLTQELTCFLLKILGTEYKSKVNITSTYTWINFLSLLRRFDYTVSDDQLVIVVRSGRNYSPEVTESTRAPIVDLGYEGSEGTSTPGIRV